MKQYYNPSEPLQPYTLLRRNSNGTGLMQVRDIQEDEQGKPQVSLIQLTVPMQGLVSMGHKPRLRNRWEDPMDRMQRESEREGHGLLPPRRKGH